MNKKVHNYKIKSDKVQITQIASTNIRLSLRIVKSKHKVQNKNYISEPSRLCLLIITFSLSFPSHHIMPLISDVWLCLFMLPYLCMNKMKINQMRTFKKHNSNYAQKIHTAEIRKICWRYRKLFFTVNSTFVY